MTEIEFEDIRKGDDIEVRWRLGDTLETRRGVAHEKSGNSWLTKDGLTLVTLLGNHVRILLHHRPAPAEPEGLGAIVWAVVGGNGWYFHRIGTGERPWINVARNWHDWSDFEPDSIEMLFKGIGVEE